MNKLKICENIYIDKIYIINLEFKKDLKEQIINQMKKYNILEYVEFIDAIYNKEFPSYGCSLSHHKALQNMKDNNYDICMILEDDCVFTEFPFIINDEIPNDWMMIYPGYLCYDKLSYKYNNSFLRVIDARSSHCYIIKKNILEYTLKTTLVNGIPIDMRYICPIQRAFPCYGIYPIKAYQSEHQSTIQNNVIINWNSLMNDTALICYNNEITDEKIKITNQWKGHDKEVLNLKLK